MAKRGVIIVAGGSGKRMQSALPKQFMMLGGLPVVAHTINTFSEALPGAEIVVVLPEEHIPLWRNLAARFDIAVHRCIAGGKERFHSVKNGLDALSAEALATKKMILRVQLAAEETGAAIPVTEVVDSYRRVDGSESYIVPRSELRIVQTPQTFSAELLRRAYEQPFSDKFTDDASVVEALGAKITLVEGERRNIKLTTPEDMLIAERLLEE